MLVKQFHVFPPVCWWFIQIYTDLYMFIPAIYGKFMVNLCKLVDPCGSLTAGEMVDMMVLQPPGPPRPAGPWPSSEWQRLGCSPCLDWLPGHTEKPHRMGGDFFPDFSRGNVPRFPIEMGDDDGRNDGRNGQWPHVIEKNREWRMIAVAF